MTINGAADEPREVTLAWQQLQEHTTVKATGSCAVCEVPGPCAVANGAAALLVERGVPVVEASAPMPTAERRAARLTLIANFRRRGKNRGPAW